MFTRWWGTILAKKLCEKLVKADQCTSYCQHLYRQHPLRTLLLKLWRATKCRLSCQLLFGWAILKWHDWQTQHLLLFKLRCLKISYWSQRHFLLCWPRNLGSWFCVPHQIRQAQYTALKIWRPLLLLLPNTHVCLYGVCYLRTPYFRAQWLGAYQ